MNVKDERAYRCKNGKSGRRFPLSGRGRTRRLD